MIASDDVVFAWAIGKALLIVIASFGILVYAAWAVTYKNKNDTHVEIPKDNALKYKNSAKAGKVLLITEEAEEASRILARTSAGEIDVHEPEQPAATA